MRRSMAVVGAALLGGIALFSPGVGQDRPQRPIETENQVDPGEQGAERATRAMAIRQDAEALAASRGINLGQAMKAIQAQDGLGDELDKLRKEHSGRVAGIYFVYEPEFKVVVRLKGQGAVDRRSLSLADGPVPVEFETGAEATAEELVDAYQRNLPAIRELFPTLQGLGTDERTGEVTVIVQAAGTAAETVRGKRDDLFKLLGHPVRIEVVEQGFVDVDVRGGSRITASSGSPRCTSGFTVKNSSGVTAMTTASHCEGMTTYYNPNGTTIGLTFVTEVRDADQDVEIHTSGYVERPEFYADSATVARVLTGRRLRSSTAAGNHVCHRGSTTGYSCGYVQLTNYTPTHAGACGTVACAAVWVLVDGDSGTACYSGDSGGPVFASQTAFGLVKSASFSGSAPGQCNYFTYMSTDFLPSGWSLLYG